MITEAKMLWIALFTSWIIGMCAQLPLWLWAITR